MELERELYPWIAAASKAHLRDEYFVYFCGNDNSDDTKKLFYDFWETVPDYILDEDPEELDYMWNNYLMLLEEPWIDYMNL